MRRVASAENIRSGRLNARKFGAPPGHPRKVLFLTTTSEKASSTPLVLFLAGNMLFGAGLFAHAFLYNFYLEHLGHGPVVMGGAAAALTAGGLTALAPAGLIVDRTGARAAYLIACAAGAAGLLAGAFVENVSAIYAAAFLAGAGTSIWRVAMGPLLMRVSAGSVRSRVFSWNVALLVGSGAAWTASAGLLTSRLERTLAVEPIVALRIVLSMGGVLTALAAVAVLLVSVPRPAAAARPATSLRDALPERPLLLSVAAIALWMCASALVIPFLNVYFSRVHSLPLARIGVLFATAQGVTALLLILSGIAAARWGARRVLTLWLFLFTPSLWLLGASTLLPIAIALYFIQGLVPPATNPLIDQILLEAAPPERHGIISSWRNAATELSGFAGAAAGGLVLQHMSFGALFGIAGAVAALGAVALYYALRYARSLRHDTRPRNSLNARSA